MKKRLMLVLCLLISQSGMADQTEGRAGNDPKVTADDFRPIAGAAWEGALQYRDYSSDKQVSIPVRVLVKGIETDRVRYRIEFPDEPQHDSDETLLIGAGGLTINDEAVISVSGTSKGYRVIKTTLRGDDNGEEVDFLITYRISESEFSIQKSVRRDGAEDSFVRNTLLLTR